MQIRALVRMEPQALIRVGFHDLQRQRHRFALNEYYNLYFFIFLPQMTYLLQTSRFHCRFMESAGC